MPAPPATIASLAAIVCLCGPARAAPPANGATPPRLHALEHTTSGALALESAAVIGAFVAYSASTGDVPEACRWCAPTRFDVSARDAIVFPTRLRASASNASHVLSLGVVPLGAFGALLVPAVREGKEAYAAEDAWIMLNAFVLTTGVTDGTKKLAARQRPAWRYGEQRATGSSDLEANLSFFSGDTAWAFSFAASGSTLAFLRGNPAAPWIATGGGALAAGTGVLRMAADMHWATDVMVGAGVGTALGVGLPLLVHRRAADEAAIVVVPWTAGGAGGTVMAAW